MKKLSLFLIGIVMFIFSCASKNEVTESTDEPAANQLATAPNTDLYSKGQTKLIKSANYRFEVDNVKKSTEAIEAAIKKYPAYLSSSELHLQNPILENKMTIRVQSEFFQDLLKEIDVQARFVNFRDVKTEDVAKQFVDLESRLKTKREVEERYREILRKKAGTIEELLTAERQIGELHEDIEATVSRINYLKEEVRYSTINLEFYQSISQEIARAHETPLSKQFGDALTSGWNVLISVVLGFAYIWPLLIIGGIAIFIYKFIKRKRLASPGI